MFNSRTSILKIKFLRAPEIFLNKKIRKKSTFAEKPKSAIISPNSSGARRKVNLKLEPTLVTGSTTGSKLTGLWSPCLTPHQEQPGVFTSFIQKHEMNLDLGRKQ